MKLLSIRIEDPKGHVLHVFDTASREKVAKQVRQALRAGHAVRWEDGSREWWVMSERVDTSKRGSEQYEWNQAGDKVRADLVRHVQAAGSAKVEKTIMPGKHWVVLS